MPRDQLDALLLVAEVEAISGLPPPPMGFPTPPEMDGIDENLFRCAFPTRRPRRARLDQASTSALLRFGARHPERRG